MIEDLFFQTLPIALAIGLAMIAYISHLLFFSGKLPEGVPWGPSGNNGILSALDSAVSTAMDVRAIFERSSVLPAAKSHGFAISTLLDGTFIALPLRNIKWLSTLPEGIASFYNAQQDRLALSFTVPAATLTDPAATKLLVKIMTRRSKSTVPDLCDEVRHACQENSCKGSDWQSLCLYPELLRISAATTNRMAVGLPLCKYEIIA